LLILSSTIIKETIEPLSSRNWKNVLILDDSLYSRNRSKAVELLARVRDHVENKYVRGFRMLILGCRLPFPCSAQKKSTTGSVELTNVSISVPPATKKG
jgi:hypothetical protein